MFLRAEGDRPLDGSAFGSVMDQLGAEVRWSKTFDLPVRYRIAAAMGERMGQLEHIWVDDGRRCLTTDHREAYTGLGSAERVSWAGPGERLAASFIAKDVAVGLPALVDYLCGRGVESVSYTITDYSAYM